MMDASCQTAARSAPCETPASAPLLEMVTVCVYHGSVPDFLAAELDRLYGSFYSSIGHFRIHDDGLPTNTYVARLNGRAIAILLYRVQRSRVQVLNEVLALTPAEINRFARHVFACYPAVMLIMLRAVRIARLPLAFPARRFDFLEDIVLTLPDSEAAYLALLGKNTRRNLKRYHKKLLAGFPSVAFRLLRAGQIEAQVIREIVALNHARMVEKHKLSAIDQRETETLIRQARLYGLVGVVTIDGRICAGAISFQCSDHFFLNVLAHDPAFDAYWLGMLCCYLTICECIRLGGKEFHFLWGEYQYKYLLNGVRRKLDNLLLFRSRAQIFCHGRLIASLWRAVLLRRLQYWLHAKKESGHVSYRAARGVLQGWRRLRQWLQASAGLEG